MPARPPLAPLLKRHMAERGTYLERLAAESGVDKTTILRWRTGETKRPHSWLAVIKVAHALRLTRAQTETFLHSAYQPPLEALPALVEHPPDAKLLERWAARPPDNLPGELTSFIGRTAELGAVTLLLQKARLVTLTGPGGSGKTRLALRVAENLLEDYRDGVWFVDLAALRDPGLVLPAIARVLDVRDRGGEPLAGSLAAYLRPRRLLLVLDNFEQVMEAGPVITTLLRAAPEAQALVTSRAALNLSGEHEFEVLPLPVPNPAAELARLAENPAITLFVERAQAPQRSFALTAENAPVIAEICARLDGLPLAIELAAARSKQFAPQALVDAFSKRLELSGEGPRDVPARQRTLRATIAWSYDLLAVAEQALFRGLAVFVGGWTEEAVAQVYIAAAEPGRASPATLLALRAQRLVRESGRDGEQRRYEMLETIREYAWERLGECGEGDRLRRQHARYYLALVERADPLLKGAEQAHWVALLEAEHDNLRAALDWFAAADDREALLKLSGLLGQFWAIRGHLTEGRQRLTTALARCDDCPAELRAKALNEAGILTRIQGDLAQARLFLAESLELWRALGHRRNAAYALNNLGLTAWHQGDHTAARAFHEESLAIKEDLEDLWGVAYSLSNLGILARDEGDTALARRRYTESVALWRRLGDPQGLAYALNNLGLVLRDERDFAGAGILYEESLALLRRLGNREGVAAVLNNLGEVARDRREYATARRLYRESLAIEREMGNRRSIAERLEGLASTAAGLGDLLDAARLWGAAERLRETIGAPLAPVEQPGHERDVAAARAQAGEAEWMRIWAEGRAMPLEQAIAYALGGAESTDQLNPRLE